MATEGKTVRVAAAVLRRGDRILAAQRSGGAFAGGWEFPGGKLEAGETPEQAVERELGEELGVTVTAGKLLETIEYDYPDFHLEMYCIECELVSGEPQLREHGAFRWLSPEELDSVEWLPADVDFVAQLKASFS